MPTDTDRLAEPAAEPCNHLASAGDAPPHPHGDWSRLMAQSQKGDQSAYRLLLKSIAPYLKVLAIRHGLGPDEVEDAVQDALLTLHAIRHTYDPGRPFGPWLTAIARHRFADHARRRGRHRRRETALTEAHVAFAAADANLQENTGDVRRLLGAISALPVGQRRAVELLRLRELSLKEASASSGQSEAALKVAVHRAIKTLRRLLAEA